MNVIKTNASGKTECPTKKMWRSSQDTENLLWHRFKCWTVHLPHGQIPVALRKQWPHPHHHQQHIDHAPLASTPATWRSKSIPSSKGKTACIHNISCHSCSHLEENGIQWLFSLLVLLIDCSFLLSVYLSPVLPSHQLHFLFPLAQCFFSFLT